MTRYSEKLDKFLASIGIDGIIFYPSEEQMKMNDYYIKNYGINLYEYQELLKKQEGKCAICKKQVSAKRLSVDHCHKTCIVRGLLCSKCNVGLGSFEDKIVNLLNAAEYLKISLKKWGLNEKGSFKSLETVADEKLSI